MNVLIILVALLVLMQAAVLVAGFILVKRIIGLARAFVEPAEAGKPSPFGLLMNAALDRVVDGLVVRIKAAFMGMASGVARSEQAEAREEAQAAIAGKSPWISMVLSVLPKRTLNKLMASPVAGLAMQKLFDQGGGIQQPMPDNNHSDYGAQLSRFGG